MRRAAAALGGTVVLAILLLTTLAVAAQAGELTGQGGDQRWRSSECILPVAPQVDKADAQALNASINRYNRYVAAVDQYNRCLRAEADADIARLSSVINGDVLALQEEAVAAAEAVRQAVATPREGPPAESQ